MLQKALELIRTNLMLILVLLISLVGIFHSARFALSSLDFYAVKNLISQWQETESVKNTEDIARAKSHLERAKALHPAHPVYTDMLGQVFEWGALSGSSNEIGDLQQAKALYSAAIQQRPTWPVTYASLILVKWRLGEFDEELIESIKMVQTLGAKKPEVHAIIIRFGLATYAENHPFYAHVRDALPKYLSLALRNQETRISTLAIIDYYQSLKTVCRWMNKQDPWVVKNALKCVQ
ncbi:VpsP family polysaccharide biosynthesis protein [Brumicola blandensis]|uniref:VpsP family polysaccharide biosynthesis protein n=1 Tax=Brumicola blandensis TaxID=3075611 RepID=A0AAW8R7G3_9ALTE|nr:VpsP family polysaccharide biosynthesis protein [Alteromonas sp. W409]MDT0584076.1 VpsP family polysaccharide biosynthesis protein [Alteromonas sp. W409]